MVWQSIRDDADQSTELRRKTWLFVLFISAQPSGENADGGALQKHFLGCYLLSKANFGKIKSSPNAAIMGYFVEKINQDELMLSLSKVYLRLHFTIDSARETVHSHTFFILHNIFSYKISPWVDFVLGACVPHSSHTLDPHAVCAESVTKLLQWQASVIWGIWFISELHTQKKKLMCCKY